MTISVTILQYKLNLSIKNVIKIIWKKNSHVLLLKKGWLQLLHSYIVARTALAAM